MTVRVGVVSVARQAFELVLVGEVLAVGAGRNQRLDDLARMAAPLDHVQQLLMRDHLVQQLLELGAGNLDAASTGIRTTRASAARLIRYASSSRSSLM